MDKGYDAGPFLVEMEVELAVVPHVEVRDGPMKAGDAPGLARKRARPRQRTKSYGFSQPARKRVEQIIGWLKGVAGLERSRFVGR